MTNIDPHGWYRKLMDGVCDRCCRKQAVCDERCNPIPKEDPPAEINDNKRSATLAKK